MRQNVSFKSHGEFIRGHLYLPENFDAGQKYPTIAVAGPMATVKEQSQGVFAKALAERGLIALAFDHRTFGESGGQPRQYEDPNSKTEDIQSAICFLRAHENVGSVGALRICAGASYTADALQGDRRVKAFGTVSGHFSLREALVSNPLATDEQKRVMYDRSNTARQRYFETGEAEPDDMLIPDMTEVPPAGADPFLAEQYDYYFCRVAAEWPNYSNHMVPFSYQQLARSHGLDYAGQITCPYLGIVGEQAFTKPFTERFIAAKTQGAAEMVVLEGGSHLRTYDTPDLVVQGADALSAFFKKSLGN